MRYIKILSLAFLSLLMFSSCASKKKIYDKNTYNWGPIADNVTNYEISSFEYCHNNSQEALCALIETYQTILNDSNGNDRLIPPGICAEFGYVLLNPDTKAVFEEYATAEQKRLMSGRNFKEYGKSLIEKEMKLYPESRVYLERITKNITNN